ncbi:MAG TPA: LacI family DNA-binding transcriptional regulator [Lapillicoccus sp.]|jgi:LacI family transcriptional regulator|uniref:LacI family DNA-binding transcriptional regulator n=1 Tax=Lapillicoccus sp. TaxID=1909287 RepID=UPI002F92A614
MTDVARLAGVSVMTVSRVLNGSQNVAASTRTRVEAALSRLSYQPNMMARGLVSGRSGTIGVITFDTVLYGPGSALLGIERAARKRGYGVSIVTLSNPTRQAMADALDSLTQRSADGVITITPQIASANALEQLAGSVPLVSVEAGHPGVAPLVRVHQRSGGRMATEHLLDLGHETVWHIAGPDDWFEGRERVEGWREALSERGAPAPRLLRGDWSAASGYAAAQSILDGTAEATAVFAGNDQMALGFMHAMFERGMTAPHPISVVGFDDIPESGFFSPALTTVRQDFDELGRRGVELLASMLAGEDVPRDLVANIVPELVVRASSARPTPA